MYNTSFKPKAVPSPFQSSVRTNRPVAEFRTDRLPVRNEIKRLCGTYELSASFEEDSATIRDFPHIPGMIAVLCSLKKDGKVIAHGRGTSILNKLNRNFDRAIGGAINGSFISAANNATKVFDLLRLGDSDQQKATTELKERHKTVLEEISEPATDKQKGYLRQLLAEKVYDEGERENWLSNLDTITKDEASDMIQSLSV